MSKPTSSCAKALRWKSFLLRFRRLWPPLRSILAGKFQTVNLRPVKRGKIIIFPIAILFILLVIFLTRSPQNDPLAPRYVPVQSQPTSPFLRESFAWGAPVPFRDGKVWIFASTSRTNHHDYLYDLDHRKVLGELLNGGVAFANQDQTKLL